MDHRRRFRGCLRAGTDLPAAPPGNWLTDTGVVDAMPTRPAPEAQPFTKPTTPSPNVNAEVQGSLDELKENLFKLELRRQAGTIAEEDYEREHARMQKRPARSGKRLSDTALSATGTHSTSGADPAAYALTRLKNGLGR